MPNIANISNAAVLFRDKAGEIVEIAPAEAKQVDVDKDHPRVAAYAKAKLIEVGGTPAQAAKAAREKALVPPVETPVTE